MSFSIKRFRSAMLWEIKIQFRYGFYYVAGVMMFLWIALFYNIPVEFKQKFLPAFVLSNLNIGTFFYVGALILYEKNQKTIDALLVTPLTFREYVSSKVGSLLILGLLETYIIIVAAFWGVEVNHLWVIVGILSMAVVYTLFGIGFAVKYKDITDFLMPSIFLVFVLELPLFAYIGLTHPIAMVLYYLSPMQPMVSLMTMATTTLEIWEIFYAVIGTVFWMGFGYIYTKRRYNKYIVLKEVS
ncbi:MAG: hypothetical protein INQ03_22490 [Candidatus Heimdallarchaeota archaeon]|nr:hypothetical protein [Candidatus Heimdallarchaeota archaeon]